MTQEQRVTRGTITIFVLSILLLLCLCATTTLAYFAGRQETSTTLILGGPVRVSLVDKNLKESTGQGNLIMNIKTDHTELLPGIGIDMQAIANVSSSDIYPTDALLRAILTISVTGINEKLALEVQKQIRDSMSECIGYRIDGIRDGWVYFDDGNYYYCNKDKQYDEVTNEEYIALLPISTNKTGNPIAFINGTFQFPYKYYTNIYSNIGITFSLRFEAIQEVIVNEDGDRIPNTIFNVKSVLDSMDWELHNN